MASTKPILLNKSFQVSHWTGSAQDEDLQSYGPQNILTTTSRPVHCSGKGQNHDLVLKYTDENGFTLTHVVVRGGTNCTAPLKDGLLWVSEEEPNLAQYSSNFNDFTLEKFNALDSATPHRPALFFTTDEKTLEFEVELPQWLTGKYVHLKWLSRYEHGGENIDVDYVAFIGFEGVGHQQFSIGEVPEELDVTRKKLRKWNILVPEFIEEIMNKPSVLAFSLDEAARSILRDLAESDQYNNFTFFYTSDAPSRFVQRLRNYFGVEQESFLLIHDNGSKYLFDTNTVYTKENITNFFDSFKAGALKKLIKSAPRPENDSDDSHPGLTIVVTSSFEELVLDPTHDVLLDVYADWCGPCIMIAPIIAQLAQLFKDKKGIRIAKIDCDSNELDRKYLPETTIPNLKLFPRNKKDSSIPFEGDRDLVSFVKFIHENVEEKFDLESVLNEAQLIVEKEKAIAMASELSTAISQIFSQVENRLSPEINESIKQVQNSFKEGLEIEEIKKFIENATTNEHVQSLITFGGELATLRQKISQTRTQLIDNEDKLSEGEKAEIRKHLEESEKLVSFIDDSEAEPEKQVDLNEARTLLQAINASSSVVHLQKIDTDVKANKEKAAMKNVLKMHDDNEFEQTLKDNHDKVIIVDFTATWCGPCKRIAPLFADLSEENREIVFLKVDVDELAESSQKAGVSAMPTFQIYKAGLKVDEFVGGDPNGLKKLLSKHKPTPDPCN